MGAGADGREARGGVAPRLPSGGGPVGTAASGRDVPLTSAERAVPVGAAHRA
ncbi:hypothetical protein Cus16_0145 [Curtobacterium sp. ER1/6]|nr:hypothetical protein Cus16_0145 [Curtobacterium sp. ER1/6]